MAPHLNGRTPILYDHRGQLISTNRDRYDDMAVPTIVTFGSILKGGMETFWHGKFDEAKRAGRKQAQKMDKDARLDGMFQERYMAVANMKWHIGVEDEYDAKQLWAASHIERAVKRTPGLVKMVKYLLRAVYYGRYASQVKWMWDKVVSEKPNGDKVAIKTLRPKKHFPLNGDKIGHMLDHTPYVLIHAGEGEQQVEGENFETTWTTEGGKGLILKGSWRDRFIIHAHEPEDADFFDADGAEAIHGVGLRSKLFWLDYLRTEWLAWVVDFMERVGLGVTIYFYEAGNPTSKAEAERAAHEQSRRSVILWPTFPDSPNKGGSVQRVETPTAGAQVLLQMIQYVDDLENRLVVGQTLSSDSEGSGLGGTGVAQLHAATKQQLVKFDAVNLGETLTRDLIEVMKKWTFPWADFPLYWIFDVVDPNPEAALGAASMLYNLGVPIRSSEVRAIGGFADPEPDDDVILSPDALQMQQMMQQGQLGQPGQMPPGAMPGMGGPPQGAPQPQPGAQPGDLYAQLAKSMGGQPDKGFDSMYSGGAA